jgi:hypothetical protein
LAIKDENGIDLDILKIFNEESKGRKIKTHNVFKRNRSGSVKMPNEFMKGKEKKEYSGTSKVKVYTIHDLPYEEVSKIYNEDLLKAMNSSIEIINRSLCQAISNQTKFYNNQLADILNDLSLRIGNIEDVIANINELIGKASKLQIIIDSSHYGVDPEQPNTAKKEMATRKSGYRTKLGQDNPEEFIFERLTKLVDKGIDIHKASQININDRTLYDRIREYFKAEAAIKKCTVWQIMQDWYEREQFRREEPIS